MTTHHSLTLQRPLTTHLLTTHSSRDHSPLTYSRLTSLRFLHGPQLHLPEPLFFALSHNLVNELVFRVPVGADDHRGVDLAGPRDDFPVAIFRPQIGLDLAHVGEGLVF